MKHGIPDLFHSEVVQSVKVGSDCHPEHVCSSVDITIF